MPLSPNAQKKSATNPNPTTDCNLLLDLETGGGCYHVLATDSPTNAAPTPEMESIITNIAGIWPILKVESAYICSSDNYL